MGTTSKCHFGSGEKNIWRENMDYGEGNITSEAKLHKITLTKKKVSKIILMQNRKSSRWRPEQRRPGERKLLQNVFVKPEVDDAAEN